MGIFSGITDMFKRPKAPDYSKLEFSPYSVSGPSGGVTYDTKAKTAEISLSPELQGFMDMYFGAATEALPSAEEMRFAGDVSRYGTGLFEDATKADLDKMTSDYYNRSLRMLAPERAAEDVRLSERLYGTGTTGLGTSVGTEGYINPLAYSQSLAREQANLGLFEQADLRARQEQEQDITRGLSLYGAGQDLRFAPYQQASGLLTQGVNLQGLADPYMGYGLNLGQGQAAAGQRIVNAQQAYDKERRSGGIFGDILTGAISSYTGGMPSLPSFSMPSFPSIFGGGYTGGGTFMPSSSSFAGSPALRSMR